MDQNIKCPKCGEDIAITQAWKHQFEEQAVASLETKHQKELDDAKREAENAAARKLEEKFQVQLKMAQDEASENKTYNRELRDQLTDLTKQMRLLKTESDEAKLQMQRTLAQEEEKIRQDAKTQAEDASRLKILELEKQRNDAIKAKDELGRKLEQGSQQTQGEVLELDIEQLLKTLFPHDEILPVEKGVNGSDIRQIVKSPMGAACGVILWECKHTKSWSEGWITKLKDDLRKEKAHIPVIVSTAMPADVKTSFSQRNGVIICSFALVGPLAALLRKSILDVAYQKAVSANKAEKKDQLYEYITSLAFRQQIEIAVEVHMEMLQQLEKERLIMEKNWSMRESHIKRYMGSIANVYGGIQGYVGSAMPQVKGFEMLALEDANAEEI